MPSPKKRRIVPVLPVLLGFLVLAPVQALPPRQNPGVLSSPERLVAALQAWFVDLWTGAFQKNGSTPDPNGQPLPVGGKNGSTPDPDGKPLPNGVLASPGGATNDNGMSIDPDG